MAASTSLARASSLTIPWWWGDRLGRLGGFRYREIVRRLKASGFEFDRQAAGSHEIWFNATTRRYTTVVNHPGDIPEGTLRAILKQAGIDADEFLRL